MSIKMSVTVDVPLKAIADVKAGKELASSSAGYEVYENVIKGITKAAIEFPYGIADTPKPVAGPFRIWINTLTRQRFSISVMNEDSMQDLAEKIEECEGIPPDHQRLIYGSKTLYDSTWVDEERMKMMRTWGSLNIEEYSELHVIHTALIS